MVAHPRHYNSPMARSARSAATASVLERLGEVVGGKGLLTDANDLEPYLGDWRGFYRGAAPAIVRPAAVEQVAAVVRICAETGTAIVPQGGNTGMSGAATPPPPAPPSCSRWAA